MEINKTHIYLAALLHDIGKFYERAYPDKYDKDDVYKWSHAVYTRRFYDDYAQVREILKMFNPEESAGDRNLINLAAKHHQPATREEKIITYADWFSSSERLPKVDEDYQEGKSRQPMVSVFSNLLYNGEEIKKRFLPLARLTLDQLPKLRESSKDVDQQDYQRLWDEFITEFKELKAITDIRVFAETLLKLLEKYTVFIPSSTRKN